MKHKTLKRIAPKHPLVIRWTHWVNFPLLMIMIWTGLLIYWSYDPYRIGWGKTTLFKFFPPGFYKALNIPHRLAEGMSFHFAFMWLFFGNGVIYVLYTIFSGEWRYLVPKRGSFKQAWQVLLHDLHLRKTAPVNDGIYNAAQRIAYTSIIVMGFGSIMTGLAIYKPVTFGWITMLCGGYAMARLIHFALTIGYCLFFLVHVGQVIIAGWQNFSSMITGFEVLKNDAPSASVPVTFSPEPEPVHPAPEPVLTEPEAPVLTEVPSPAESVEA